MDYHMSLMSRKLVAHLAQPDLELFNPSKQQPTILYTSEVDTIAGYPCRKAVAVFDAMDRAECEIWYTDRIHMANPNWFSPFAEIPGVLLRYDVVQYGLRMRLNAIAVNPSDVDGAKFIRKPDFQEVSAEVLYRELGEILETFSM
jgi:GLPGLI family protein